MRRLTILFMSLFLAGVCFGQTITPAEEGNGCKVEVRAEAGYSPASHNLYVGSPGFFNRPVVQQTISLDVCTNKKLRYGGVVAMQQSLRAGKSAYDRADFSGYLSYRLPKKFEVLVGLGKDSFTGWKFLTGRVELSKLLHDSKNISLRLKNTTYKIWNPKQTMMYGNRVLLLYSGNWINKTSLEVKAKLKNRLTLTLAPAVSFDDNPYNVGINKHVVSMGWVSGKVDLRIFKGFGIYANLDWYSKLNRGGFTDRQGSHLSKGYGVSYTKVFSF